MNSPKPGFVSARCSYCQELSMWYWRAWPTTCGVVLKCEKCGGNHRGESALTISAGERIAAMGSRMQGMSEEIGALAEGLEKAVELFKQQQERIAVLEEVMSHVRTEVKFRAEISGRIELLESAVRNGCPVEVS